MALNAYQQLIGLLKTEFWWPLVIFMARLEPSM
jgi:hypothetical protein